MGHFRVTICRDRSRSFSAKQDSSYYAAAGVASRASVLPYLQTATGINFLEADVRLAWVHLYE